MGNSPEELGPEEEAELPVIAPTQQLGECMARAYEERSCRVFRKSWVSA
jgi:hypothetical protein